MRTQTLTTDERYINLNPKQMIHLSQYFYDIRPKLASEYSVQTNRLFFSCGDAAALEAVMSSDEANQKGISLREGL